MPLKLGAFGSAVLYRTALRHLGVSQAVEWAIFADPTKCKRRNCGGIVFMQMRVSAQVKVIATAAQSWHCILGLVDSKSSQSGRNGRTCYTAGARASRKSTIAADWKRIETQSCN
ncbi:hypothetical protein T440DRAFT_478934 [Plenodomus tracheiphilus IPT5]|uniref:Uncharacterized protein n=1 Tax=Plenodomus tracheiphilus IPT5 TaxID=1408161 RepID=A0A6A7B8N7_9PLEO|nr:hypothetical protein T440DRAFT_478934 [Plenodomus tracheiphilus IPT5]